MAVFQEMSFFDTKGRFYKFTEHSWVTELEVFESGHPSSGLPMALVSREESVQLPQISGLFKRAKFNILAGMSGLNTTQTVKLGRVSDVKHTIYR